MEGKMRLKSVVKYSISEMKRSIIIFYGIMALILATLYFLKTIMHNNNVSSAGATELASSIFLFVLGLNSFKQNYLFLSANSMTRKAQFSGFLISSIIVVIIMAAIDTAYGNIVSQFVNCSPMLEWAYKGFVVDTPKPLIFLIGFVLNAALYLSMMVLGYFFTTLYYRMSKPLKVTVSVGIPVLLTMVLPAIDSTITNGKISDFIGDTIVLLAGLRNGSNPFALIVSLLIGSVILSVLAFLLVRKAPVKE
jgi:hypothetical protein